MTEKKKEKKTKKNKKATLNNVTFHCISCDNEYVTKGVFEKNNHLEQVSSCSGCSIFYTGKSATETKFGRVEKFYQRLKKNTKKN